MRRSKSKKVIRARGGGGDAVEKTFQVIDSMLFHEYTVVNRQVVKVTAWLPPSWSPALSGLYQGLVKKANGEKRIEFFLWDGFLWKNVRTGRFMRQSFYWRGLSEDPNI